MVTWHHKFAPLSKILHAQYAKAAKSEEFRDTFPEPPIMAYRRAKNLSDKLIRANHRPSKVQPSQTPQTPQSQTQKTQFDGAMSTQSTITNTKSGRSSTIPGGRASDSNLIYAAECTRHSALYVGMTGGKLSGRFAGHKSDIKHYPDRCELPSHFRKEGCNFNTDLKIYILEHIRGGEAQRLHKEDKWIRRLDTKSPNGLNVHTSEFASIYGALFN